MVNIVIYLKSSHNPQELVKHLLAEKLIASASIDENNVFYKMEQGELLKEIYNVITAATKSLLFDDIVKAVEGKIGEETPISSIPIVGFNKIYTDTIRESTLAR